MESDEAQLQTKQDEKLEDEKILENNHLEHKNETINMNLREFKSRDVRNAHFIQLISVKLEGKGKTSMICFLYSSMQDKA